MVNRPLVPKDLRIIERKSPYLVVLSWASVAATLHVRCITPNGLVPGTITTTANRAIQTSRFALPDLPNSLVIACATAAVQRGQVYAHAYIELAGIEAGAMAADYVTRPTPLMWPGGAIRASTEGRGYLHTLYGTDPGANVEIAEAVPTNALWLIKGIRYQFLTAAGGANRTSRLEVGDEFGADLLFSTPNAVQAGGVSRTYYWFPYLAVPAAWDINIFGYHSPILLPPGAIIATATENFAAADNYGAPSLLLEEWILP